MTSSDDLAAPAAPAGAGRLGIKLFPANQLGSDAGLPGQVRNGT